MSAQEHKEQAAASQVSVAIAIVTVSDTRTTETDRSGQTIRALAEEAGHRIVEYRIVKDEPVQVQAALDDFSTGEAQMLIFNGGTGVSRRDRPTTCWPALWKRNCPALARYSECSAMPKLARRR